MEMLEQIKVRNFLVLKKVDVKVKNINVIIGPQANGKSLIAKLLSFFSNVSEDFLEGIRKNETKPALDKRIISKFETRFPRYAWEGASFEIEYQVDELVFTLCGRKSSKNKTILTLCYSDVLAKKYRSKKSAFQRKLKEIRETKSKTRTIRNVERQAMHEVVYKPLKDSFPNFFKDSIFIPATRSFFANLQKNIFTFLASNLDIDPYLKEFGSTYENSKYWYKDDLLTKHNKELMADIYKIIEAIVQGEYEYHDDQDWIVNKGRRLNLANASSGQQESLPMLLVLSVWPLVAPNENGLFFIEEPEAHLFPNSQGLIISLLSLIHKKVGTRFFITTHSPYILSAINNFILAGDTVKAGSITEEKFRKINKGAGNPLLFEDISAYTVIDGTTSNIADQEYRMIGGEVLDSISEHFEEVMNQLLLCEQEGK